MTENVRDINSEILADLAEHSVDCIWLYDLSKDCFKYFSPSVVSLLGMTADEALQKKLEDVLSPDSLKLAEAIFAGLADEQISIDVFEIKDEAGSLKSVEITSRLLMTEQNSHCVLGSIHDISSWKNREEILLSEIDKKDRAIHKLMASEKELANLTLELLAKNDALRELAITDDMTGLNNRYYFDRRVAEEIERSERYDTPLAMMIFDLDRFKNINDTWGHDIGDKVLISVTTVAKNNIRKPDILARWGGEEFVILVPQTDLLGAAALSEKLREAIATTKHPGVGAVTASFGVAEKITGEPFESWFRRADQALYQAKSKGRNCVVCSSSDAGMPINLVKLEWKTIWECGNPIIDEQHKKLIELANSLIDLASHKVSTETAISLFNQLIEHLIHHFTQEEQIIADAGFPDTPRHAERHQNLVKKILRLNNNLMRAELTPSTFFTFLVDEVIVGHMLIEDVLFFPYIRKMMEVSA